MQLALEKLLDGPVLHGGTQILTREDGKHPNAAGNLPSLVGSSLTACLGL